MSDQKAGPQVIRFTIGQPLATEPHAADYSGEIKKATYDAIDAAHPQNVASQGRCVAAFNW